MPIKPNTNAMNNRVLANEDLSKYILRGSSSSGMAPVDGTTQEVIFNNIGNRTRREITYRPNGQNDTTIFTPSGHQIHSKVRYQDGVPVREHSVMSPEGEIINEGSAVQKMMNRISADKFDPNKERYINAVYNEGSDSFYDRADQLKKAGSFEQGGIMDCLRGGKPYHECKKCGGKVQSAKEGEKVRRTDKPGYAYTLPNGIDVLTQDAVGSQPLPGSNYAIEGSVPEIETQRTVLTDKGGNPVVYNYDIYTNDGDQIFPTNRYTTKRMFIKPST